MKNDDMNTKIGAWMRRKRQEAKLSQQEVADRMGHTRTAVYYWENGKRTIYATNLLEFCKVMSIEGCSDSLELFYLCVLHFVALKNAPPVWLGRGS